VGHVTETAAHSPRSRQATTARQWQLAHGPDAVEWMHSSGVAERMLSDICAAVETTVEWLVQENPQRAQWVLRQYPKVLKCCDHLQFNDPAQALAYLILHLPDRYARMFQVLERLLLSGRLPVGKSDSFAAIDIGAGPGPGMFAIRSFYVALARYATLNDPSWPIAPLGTAHIVERSLAMPYVLRKFSLALGLIEQGHVTGPGADRSTTPNPFADELGRSARPFQADYVDFTALDVRQEHQRARDALAERLYNEDGDLTRSDARRLAYEEPIWAPSAYALAVMMNFLTTTDAIPRFSEAIDRLMRGSLVPGGTILVLGAVGREYPAIYAELDQRVNASRLTVLAGFDEPLQAGLRSDELVAIQTLTRGLWNRLETLAGGASQTRDELREMGAADIFDELIAFVLPRFRVRAYRRGR
jgi:hypothetical protein